MNAGAVARAARGGLTRRRVQTIVLGLVVLVSTAASVLALALVVDSSAPFDHALAVQRGADVTASINPARATPARLVQTARLPGVLTAAGPFAEATVTVQQAGSCGPAGPGDGQGGRQAAAAGGIPCPGPLAIPPITLAGRASPGGPVDDLTLQSGHWPQQPGQVVLSAGSTGGFELTVPLGSRLTVLSAPGKPTLTVVGYANSVTSSAGGWVVPAAISGLRSPRSPATGEMLFRFRSAGSASLLRADMRAVAAALPPGSVTGSQSYLAAMLQETGNIAPFVPFLVAFGVIGMVMSVLIVINVVSGAVVAGYRRIGVLKSIGFTPGQVIAAYSGQVTVPAVAGALVGLVVGNLLAVPVLGKTADAYGVGALRVPVWVDVSVPVAMCCLTGLAAMLTALRAGRLSAVRAIAIGRAPRSGRGYAAHRLFGRLWLPRPVTIGLAAPFARPARTVLTLAAVLLGAIAVTFAAGLNTSLNLVVADLSHVKAQPVQVMLPGGPGGPGPGTRRGPGAPDTKEPTAAAAQRAITAALRAQPGTLRYVAQADRLVTVPGLSGPVALTAFRASAEWTGYALISGHWYTGPGQVVVPTHFLTVTGARIGDSITLVLGSKQIRARIVGQVFDTQNDGLSVLTDWRTVASAVPGLTPDRYDIGLRPGTSADAYARTLQARLGTAYFVMANDRSSDVIGLMIGLTAILTLLLAIVAGLGVLNAVVLHTTERVHDLGVFRAVGMTPRQTITMVVCWVAGTGLVAGLIAVPAGVALHRLVLPAMAAGADVGLPASILNVYGAPELAGLALAGVAIAVAGAMLPASWAAAARTASALHAE